MMKIEQLKNSRGVSIPYKYMVIIENGEDWRLFNDYSTLCEFMGLDEVLLKKHFEKWSFYTAYNFTVFRVQEESKTKHRGYHRV